MQAPDSTLARIAVQGNIKWLLSGLHCFVIVWSPCHNVLSTCLDAPFNAGRYEYFHCSKEILVSPHLLSICMAPGAHLGVWQMCTTK